MRHVLALLLVAAAGCGGGSSPAPTTPPPIGNQPERSTAPAGEPQATPTEPDPSATCPEYSTIRLELEYDGHDCAGPTSLAFDYNPIGEPSFDISAESPDVGVASLHDVSFSWIGCTIDARWVRSADEVWVGVYATGPTTMAGNAMWGECTASVTGSILVWP